MENSWGRNVQDYGLGDIGATVCARWLFDPNVIITNADHIWETGIFALWHLPDMVTDHYVSSTGSGIPHTNFPYGIPVEPNVRV